MIAGRQKQLCMLLGLGFALSLFGCIGLGYLLIDQAVTLSYLEDSQTATARSLKRVSSLLQSEWKGLPEGALLQKLEVEANKNPSEHILVKRDTEPAVVWFDDIQFHIESGKVQQLTY